MRAPTRRPCAPRPASKATSAASPAAGRRSLADLQISRRRLRARPCHPPRDERDATTPPCRPSAARERQRGCIVDIDMIHRHAVPMHMMRTPSGVELEWSIFVTSSNEISGSWNCVIHVFAVNEDLLIN